MFIGRFYCLLVWLLIGSALCYSQYIYHNITLCEVLHLLHGCLPELGRFPAMGNKFTSYDTRVECHQGWNRTRAYRATGQCANHCSSTAHPSLSHAAPIMEPRRTHHWATLHTPLSHAEPIMESCRTHHRATPHPLLSHAAPIIEPRRTHHWATPHPSLSHAAPIIEPSRTQHWATPHPYLSHAAPIMEPRRAHH